MPVIKLHLMSILQILSDTRVRLWWSSRLVAQGSLGTSSDGLHASHVAVKYDTQVSMFWEKLHRFSLFVYYILNLLLQFLPYSYFHHFIILASLAPAQTTSF